MDMAVLQASLPASWDAMVIPTQERLPQIGEEIAALGFPDIAFRVPDLVLHVGRIESIARGYRGGRFITVSFPSGPGLSGAPLLDANGYCIGVVVENTYMAIRPRRGGVMVLLTRGPDAQAAEFRFRLIAAGLLMAIPPLLYLGLLVFAANTPTATSFE